ncbi:MAG: SDR family NAD(P)-dependent oxidoreductase [Rhodothermales bacterium]
MNQLVKDKVILVTGSTTGIGEFVARRVVAEGGRVMVHGRSEPRAAEIVEELGDAAAYTLGDLQDPDVAGRLVDATVDRFGRLDGLVNNAALLTRSNLDDTDVELFDRLVAVNLRAPMLLTKAAVDQFRSQGGGVIVNVGSINALGGERNLLVYSMTKGGMQTMTRNLSSYLVHEGIRINQINVGWTLTDNEKEIKIQDGLEDGWWENIPPAHAPSGRIFSPEEVAAHVVFWLSDEAGPVNGSVFEIEQFPMVGQNASK